MRPSASDPFADEPAAAAAVNRLALASVVLGAAWLAGIGSVLALVLGVVAKRQIAESEGAQGGGGYASLGIVLGMVGLVALVVVAVLVGLATLPSTPAEP